MHGPGVWVSPWALAIESNQKILKIIPEKLDYPLAFADKQCIITVQVKRIAVL
jgi:hypothetical protein